MSADQVNCNRDPACGCTWPRDPVLEVACPTCNAPIGVKCRRPSGHRVYGGQPHDSRDILADQQGHYGECPLGLCGLKNARPASTQGRLL